jgi:DNA-binding transcriptional LysR family regulator
MKDDGIDLGMLRAFDHLLAERHVTRAARKAGLSQPAMSRALARMRAVFHDPLFVRSARGMIPTPRAEALAPEVRALLDGATALVRRRGFDPKTLQRVFTVATTDLFDAAVLPRLTPCLEDAPGVSVATRPIASDAVDQLASGALDLIVAMRSTIPQTCMAAHLFDDRFVCAVRKDHPTVGRTLTLARFVELPHVLIAPRGVPGGAVDAALEKRGLRRRVAMLTHSFVTAPLVIASSDLVLTGPSRILLPMARAFALRVMPPPLDVPGFSIHLGWHPRVHQDPAHAWFRDVVRRNAVD